MMRDRHEERAAQPTEFLYRLQSLRGASGDLMSNLMTLDRAIDAGYFDGTLSLAALERLVSSIDRDVYQWDQLDVANRPMVCAFSRLLMRHIERMITRPTGSEPHQEVQQSQLAQLGAKMARGFATTCQAMGLREYEVTAWGDAARFFKSTGDAGASLDSKLKQSQTLIRIGRYDEALAVIGTMFPAVQQTDIDRDLYVNAFVLRAQAHSTLGRSHEILPLAEAMLAKLDEFNLDSRATCLEVRARALEDLGQNVRALEEFIEAERLWLRLDDRTRLTRNRISQAGVLVSLRRYDDAVHYYQDAELAAVGSENLLAIADFKLRYGWARVFAAGVGDPTPIDVDSAKAIWQLELAQNELEEAVHTCSGIGLPADGILWQAWYGIARFRASAKALDGYPLFDRADVAEAVNRAIVVIEGLAAATSSVNERQSLRIASADVYRMAVELAIDDGDVRSAFEYAQQAKGRFIADLLSDRLPLDANHPFEARLSHIREAQRISRIRSQNRSLWPDADIAAYGSGPRSAQQVRIELNEAARSFAENNPERAQLLFGNVATLDQIRDCLLPAEALLESATLADGGVVLFLVKPESPLLMMEIEAEALKQAVRLCDERLAEVLALSKYPALMEALDEPLREFHKLFIQPFEEAGALDGIEHLIISPSGVLHRVPWAALSRFTRPQNGERYLYEDYLLSLTPSATSLWLLRLRQQASLETHPRLVAAAPFDPSAPSPITTTRPLPASRREVECVAGILLDADPSLVVTTLLGAEATRERLLTEAQPGIRFLVAASHGKAPNGDASVLDFELQLAPSQAADQADGIKVFDAYAGRLPMLHTFEVVLSACDLSKVLQRGDEAMGFSQAFLSAGAQVVLAPIWEINDDAAAHFSILYHAALAAPERPCVAESVRRAMTAVRDAATSRVTEQSQYWVHPYFWAACLPAGDGAHRLPLSFRVESA